MLEPKVVVAEAGASLSYFRAYLRDAPVDGGADAGDGGD
jgi:hypothetical protein